MPLPALVIMTSLESFHTQRHSPYKYTPPLSFFSNTSTTMGYTQTNALILLSLVSLLGLFSAGSAQAPAPGPGLAPAEDCFNSLLNMSDCLTFVEMGSNVSKPDNMCCPSLAGLVESSPICLCQLLGNTSAIGIPIDLNKALTLPTVCNVSTPPISLCSVIGVPVGAPTAIDMPGSPQSEGMVPTMTPDMAPPGSGGSRSIIKFSQVIIVGLSSAAVAILF